MNRQSPPQSPTAVRVHIENTQFINHLDVLEKGSEERADAE